MSVDTSHARPTSPDGTLSAWTAFRQANGPVWAAERATRCAAIRQELDEQTVPPRTAQDALADVRRYTEMLKVPAVIASAPWTRDIEAKLRVAKAELKHLRRTGGVA